MVEGFLTAEVRIAVVRRRLDWRRAVFSVAAEAGGLRDFFGDVMQLLGEMSLGRCVMKAVGWAFVAAGK
jgi:hypothetical protein